MKKEFIVERQGKSFVLYAGLLDLAHQNGLKEIRTELVQIPTTDNHQVAICVATVLIETEGVARIFTGIGDAAPENVSPAMRTVLIRMAETRAKARALRDAVNVGVAAFEELGDDESHEAPARNYNSRTPRERYPAPEVREAPKQVQPPPKPAAVSSTPISDSQRGAITKICESRGLNLEQELAKYGAVSLAMLSSENAAELIRTLNSKDRH